LPEQEKRDDGDRNGGGNSSHAVVY
jgi:hypothetical protein